MWHIILLVYVIVIENVISVAKNDRILSIYKELMHENSIKHWNTNPIEYISDCFLQFSVAIRTISEKSTKALPTFLF